MYVLRNENLAGQKLATGEGLLVIDPTGVVEVKTKEIADILITTAGFESIAQKKSKSKSEDKIPEVADTKKEPPTKVEEPPKVEEAPRRKWRKKHDA